MDSPTSVPEKFDAEFRQMQGCCVLPPSLLPMTFWNETISGISQQRRRVVRNYFPSLGRSNVQPYARNELIGPFGTEEPCLSGSFQLQFTTHPRGFFQAPMRWETYLTYLLERHGLFES